MAEKEVVPDLASLVADIAREECRKLYEKRLAGLEEELAALYKTLEEYQQQVTLAARYAQPGCTLRGLIPHYSHPQGRQMELAFSALTIV